MIVGFSKYSSGSGKRVCNYLTNEKNPVTNELRDVCPEVIQGDIEKTVSLIDSLEFKHTYTSGVLSFAPGKTVTPKMEKEIISDFEKAAFAGLERDQYTILWVRHGHAQHHELHFVVPRVELSTGKSMNIKPPGKEAKQLFDDFRTLVNERYGFARPDDPERARVCALPNYLEKLKAEERRLGKEVKEDIREGIHKAIEKQVSHGLIKSRDDVIKVLHESDFQTPRIGKDYITVSDGEKKIRMKGLFYEQQFKSIGAIKGKLRGEALSIEGDRARDIRSVSKRFEGACERRAEYNHKRFPGYQRELHKALGRTEELTLSGSRGITQRDSGVAVVEKSFDVARDSSDFSGRLAEYVGSLELYDGKSFRVNGADRARETYASESTVLNSRGVSKDDGKRSKKRLGSVVSQDRQGEVRSDSKSRREFVDMQSNEMHKVGGVNDRIRAVLVGGFEAIRERAKRAREAFNCAISGFNQKVRTCYERFCNITETIRGTEHTHQQNLERLQEIGRERKVKLGRSYSRGIER